MAKIGNEAKLVLKLAEERIQAKVKKHGEEAALCDGQDTKLATAYRNKAAGLEAALKESPFAGGTNAELIERGNQVCRLVDKRQDEKRAVQAEAMKKVLEDVLKGVGREL